MECTSNKDIISGDADKVSCSVETSETMPECKLCHKDIQHNNSTNKRKVDHEKKPHLPMLRDNVIKNTEKLFMFDKYVRIKSWIETWSESSRYPPVYVN